jgi:hypothetical protein
VSRLSARRIASTGAGVVLLVVAIGASSAAAVDTVSAGAPQGNVTPTFQPTADVAVVAQSAPVDGRVALLLHNGTDQPVRIDLVTGVATRGDGGFAVRARSTKSYPQVLAPDQLALTAVKFSKKSFPTDASITATVRSTPVSALRAERVLSTSDLVLSPPMTGAVAQTMRATLTNATTSWNARLPEVAVMCFGEASKPSTFTSARASVRRLAAGKTATSTIPLSSLCPSYLVAARAS